MKGAEHGIGVVIGVVIVIILLLLGISSLSATGELTDQYNFEHFEDLIGKLTYELTDEGYGSVGDVIIENNVFTSSEDGDYIKTGEEYELDSATKYTLAPDGKSYIEDPNGSYIKVGEEYKLDDRTKYSLNNVATPTRIGCDIAKIIRNDWTNNGFGLRTGKTLAPFEPNIHFISNIEDSRFSFKWNKETSKFYTYADLIKSKLGENGQGKIRDDCSDVLTEDKKDKELFNCTLDNGNEWLDEECVTRILKNLKYGRAKTEDSPRICTGVEFSAGVSYPLASGETGYFGNEKCFNVNDNTFCKDYDSPEGTKGICPAGTNGKAFNDMIEKWEGPAGSKFSKNQYVEYIPDDADLTPNQGFPPFDSYPFYSGQVGYSANPADAAELISKDLYPTYSYAVLWNAGTEDTPVNRYQIYIARTLPEPVTPIEVDLEVGSKLNYIEKITDYIKGKDRNSVLGTKAEFRIKSDEIIIPKSRVKFSYFTQNIEKMMNEQAYSWSDEAGDYIPRNAEWAVDTSVSCQRENCLGLAGNFDEREEKIAYLHGGGSKWVELAATDINSKRKLYIYTDNSLLYTSEGTSDLSVISFEPDHKYRITVFDWSRKVSSDRIKNPVCKNELLGTYVEYVCYCLAYPFKAQCHNTWVGCGCPKVDETEVKYFFDINNGQYTWNKGTSSATFITFPGGDGYFYCGDGSIRGDEKCLINTITYDTDYRISIIDEGPVTEADEEQLGIKVRTIKDSDMTDEFPDGKNPWKAGNIINEADVIETDFCVLDNTQKAETPVGQGYLHEFYLADNAIKEEDIEVGENEKCMNGAIVKV